MSLSVLGVISGLAVCNAWSWNDYSQNIKLPYETEIKHWEFLDKEPEIVLDDIVKTEPTDPYDIIYQLMTRVFGSDEYNNQFKLELIEIDANQNNRQQTPLFLPKSRENHPFWSKMSTQSLDIIELDNDGKNIILRGTSTIALAVAFNWYLQDICNTTYVQITFHKISS